MTSRRLSRLQLAGIAAVLLALAVPLPYRIAPSWSMRLVDNAGRPQGGVSTLQTWRHPLLQPEQREETKLSDAAGQVTFEERKIWNIGAVIAYRTLSKVLGVGMVSGFGPVVWVQARKSAEFSGANLYVGGEPQQTLVIRRDGVCPADDVAAGWGK